MTKPINPLRGNVAVAPIFEKNTYETSSSSVVIHKPDQYKGRCTQGIVKYIGDKVKDLKVGDYIFFSAYTGSLWEYKNELLLIMPEWKVKAKLEMYQDQKEISGLHFKGRLTEEEIQNTIREVSTDLKLHTDIKIIENAVRMGIALGRNSFFTATQDMVVEFLAMAQEGIKCNEIDKENPENFMEETEDGV